MKEIFIFWQIIMIWVLFCNLQFATNLNYPKGSASTYLTHYYYNHQFYCKFGSLSRGRRSSKIGWDLTKLPAWVWWQPFGTLCILSSVRILETFSVWLMRPRRLVTLTYCALLRNPLTFLRTYVLTYLLNYLLTHSLTYGITIRDNN